MSNGFNPNLNRGRNKKSFFGDFYFPKLNLLIELDGSQHNTEEAMIYDIERDQHIKNCYQTQIIRISQKEYKDKSKLELIKTLLS
jgi:very-short-patch-repair endonuclease